MPQRIKVQIQLPQETRVVEISGRDAEAHALSRLLRHEGMPLNTRCGERGLCDGCVVELVRGKLIRQDRSEEVEVGAESLAIKVQACQYRLAGDTVVLRVPQRAVLAYEPHVLDEFVLNVSHAITPPPQEASQVTLADKPPVPRSDVMPAAVGSPVGVAIDVGTTTVVVAVVDLATGDILGRASGFNRQMHLGDDVLTRINLCMVDKQNIGRLQLALVKETLEPLLAEALSKAKALPEQLAAVTAAGNTTMLHLLAGVDPSSLGMVPFTPVFLEHRAMSLADIGLTVGARVSAAEAYLLPGAGAYVGADLCAGALASGLVYDSGPSLLVDVGTNGEIILKHGDELLGCATAAGPAFEGAGLADGIRAGEGAIDHVRLSGDPFAIGFDVIGNGGASQPVGMCGSAYIDLLSECRRIELLSTTGRFQPNGIKGADARFDDNPPYGRSLRVATGRGGKGIHLTETDVASLLQAKAAIAAGILSLLERAKLAPSDIKTLYLAGGFGMHLNIDSAFGCGLLPGFERRQVKLVGNSSLAGAYLALVDRSVLPELERIGRRMDVLELNLEPGFEDRFIDQLHLP